MSQCVERSVSDTAKHPSASMYVDFDDFAFYELEISQAYLVAGFGRIETIPASVLAAS
jgi:hypothetical protein